MEQTVFVEVKFWLLVLFSLVAPMGIVWFCLTMHAVSRGHLLTLGLVMVAIAGFDIYLLQALTRMSRVTPSLADDAVFDSEITVALYVLPALLAGVGVDLVSHVLIQHLTDAQRRLVRRSHPQPHSHAVSEDAPPPAAQVPSTRARPNVAAQ